MDEITSQQPARLYAVRPIGRVCHRAGYVGRGHSSASTGAMAAIYSRDPSQRWQNCVLRPGRSSSEQYHQVGSLGCATEEGYTSIGDSFYCRPSVTGRSRNFEVSPATPLARGSFYTVIWKYVEASMKYHFCVSVSGGRKNVHLFSHETAILRQSYSFQRSHHFLGRSAGFTTTSRMVVFMPEFGS